jgi:hypothetical protein
MHLLFDHQHQCLHNTTHVNKLYLVAMQRTTRLSTTMVLTQWSAEVGKLPLKHKTTSIPPLPLSTVCGISDSTPLRNPHPPPMRTRASPLTALSAVCSIFDSMPLKNPPSPSSRLMRTMVSHVPVYLHDDEASIGRRWGGACHTISWACWHYPSSILQCRCLQRLTRGGRSLQC